MKRREAQIALIKEALQLKLTRKTSIKDNRIIESLMKSLEKDKKKDRNAFDINGFKQNLISCLTHSKIDRKTNDEGNQKNEIQNETIISQKEKLMKEEYNTWLYKWSKNYVVS